MDAKIAVRQVNADVFCAEQRLLTHITGLFDSHTEQETVSLRWFLYVADATAPYTMEM